MELLRTLLFVPGNRERMLRGARTSAADAIVIDLEDAVPAAEKAAARAMAKREIGALAEAGRRVFVRVNGLKSGKARADLMAVVGPGLAGVVLPKTESPQDLRDLDVLLREAEMARKVRPGDIGTIPLIESARGVLRCEEIVRASDRVMALSIGGEDYAAELGVARSADGVALQHIRGVVVNVAAAYGVAAIDTPYIDFKDEAGLVAEARLAKAMGLKGKYVIHPSQVEPVNAVFVPTAAEVARARAIIDVYARGLRRKRGTVSLDGMMVDAPLAARAQAVVDAAGGAAR